MMRPQFQLLKIAETEDEDSEQTDDTQGEEQKEILIIALRVFPTFKVLS